VVQAIREIGSQIDISQEQLEVSKLAGWFHDTGFSVNYEGHEEHSCDLAENFLKEEGFDAGKIERVKSCIRSTHLRENPETICEELLCDADMMHLCNKSYFDQLDNLRKEWQVVLGKTYSDIQWHKQNLNFLTQHSFYTSYAKLELEQQKKNNIKKQQKKIKKIEKEQELALISDMGIDPEELKEMQKKLKKADARPDRGIETMFRVTSRNHIDFSSMADNKANILISVNAIIISILIGSLFSKLDTNPHLIIPSSFTVAINMITIVFSILATRPNVTVGKFTKEDIKQRKVNLLFFGNFHKMSRKDYQMGMQETMSDSKYLYSSLIDDIYFNGKVLGKKYRYLRTAFNIFMFGLIISVILFLIANYIFLKSTLS
jgi:predicted metal-dependent HD superfamily phosphohydrolase